jgi:hypothetical protein
MGDTEPGQLRGRPKNVQWLEKRLIFYHFIGFYKGKDFVFFL